MQATALNRTTSKPGTDNIRLEAVSKSFGGPDPALNELSLEILDKELLVLLGPSGCGKTTLLNILAGLDRPTQGEVYFGSQRVTDVPAEERDISMVFQSIGLYPHMNAIDNITFPLRMRKVARAVIDERVETMSSLLGIGRLLKRRINELSGGERQRVAIAKALLKRPRLFLLDEAFSNLDADLRRQLRSELVRIHHELDITMVFVTHDQEEAMSIADRIAVLNAGRLVQVGAPLEIYRHPATAWTARFIGAYPINLFRAELMPGGAMVQIEGQPPLALDAATQQRWQAARVPSQVILAVRPEHLRLSSGGLIEMQATIHIREVLGDSILYHLRAGEHQYRAVRPASEVYELDQPIGLAFDWMRVFVFDAQTERALVA